MSEEKKIGGRAFGETLNVEKFIEEQGQKHLAGRAHP